MRSTTGCSRLLATRSAHVGSACGPRLQLLLICAGAVALVVSSALLSAGGLATNAVNWARIIVEVSNLFGVLVVTSVGAWIGRKVTTPARVA